jgi:hypothetical protein
MSPLFLVTATYDSTAALLVFAILPPVIGFALGYFCARNRDWY